MLFKVLIPGHTATTVDCPNIKTARQAVRAYLRGEVAMFKRTMPVHGARLAKLYAGKIDIREYTD